jgi:hypothetical protein
MSPRLTAYESSGLPGRDSSHMPIRPSPFQNAPTEGTARNDCGTLYPRRVDVPCGASHTEVELPFPGYSDEVTGMSTSAPPPGTPGSVGQRIDEAIELIQMELRHAIAYVNDAVVPQVRRESISAMRTVADTLRSLADRMEPSSRANSQSNAGTASQSSPKGPQP